MTTALNINRPFEIALNNAKEQNRKDKEYLMNNLRLQSKLANMKEQKVKQMRQEFEEKQKRLHKVQEENQKQIMEKNQQVKERQTKVLLQAIKNKRHLKSSSKTASYFNPYLVQENNELQRITYRNKISERIKIFSINKDRHMNEIRDKFENINLDVENHHENYIQQQRMDNKALRDSIDLQGAMQLRSYRKYQRERDERLREYNDRLDERANEVRNRKRYYMSLNEDDVQKISKDLKDGKFIYDNDPLNKLIFNEGSKTTNAFSQRMNELKLKQLEKRERIYMDMKNSHSEIINNQFIKFRNANMSERNVFKKQEHSLLQSVYNNENMDYKLVELNRKVDKEKNNSVFKIDPSKFDYV